ncbi:MAG: RNA polymerase sigma factor RpoS, partial [Proteobacteria bacterium]|nr:RNA polymerase sigma factor RpoS [Pseudomonadota bacterium]
CLRAARRLRQDGDRAPTFTELAQHLGRDLADVERLMALHDRTVVQTAPGDGNGSGPVDRLHARRETGPSQCAQKESVHEIVDHWVCELGDKQRAVVERRFGLHGYRRATLEQIGAEFGVTRERVRQIQLDALKNLREMMESHGISGDTLLD